MERWMQSYPTNLLPKPKGRRAVGVLPPRRAYWRKEAHSDRMYLADDSNAVPEAGVYKDDLEDLFPGYATILGEQVGKVLRASSSGVMNDYEVSPPEQVAALRALLACPSSTCDWAPQAAQYLIEAGSYADDMATLPVIVEALKKPDVDKDLVRALLPRTNIDRVLEQHGLPRTSRGPTSVREYLMRTASEDVEFLYGLPKEGATGPSSRTRSRAARGKRGHDGGDVTDEEGDAHRSLYHGESYDLFAVDGKAPVGAGKLLQQ